VKILNDKGLTIAEAVIAMVLLAVVTVGIYGVIMASLRAGRVPDTKEDMAYAVEQASAKIKTLITNSDPLCVLWDDNAANFSCLMIDSCINFSGGACAGRHATCSEEAYPGSGYDIYGCRTNNYAAVQEIRNALSGVDDVCGRPLPNQFVRDGNNQIVVADGPFETGKDYHIEECFPVPSCAGDYSLSYRVYDAGGGRLNVRFRASCDGVAP